jgi:dolichol-phosphate mannosyltransferase
MKPIKLSIIAPFLNEEDNIIRLTDTLNSFFSGIKHFEAEVIFVDDGSTDNSVKILKQQKHHAYSCKLISLSKNFGSHAALRAGILNATGDYVTFIYADLQDPLDLILKMFDRLKLENDKDIIWATRKTTQSGILEGLFSKMYARLMKKFVSDLYPTNGFDIVMFSKKVGILLSQNIENNSSVFLQILTLGFRQSSIEYDKTERKLGTSKWTLSKKIKLFIDSFIAFSYAPIRFVTVMGFLFFFFGVIWTLYVVFREIIYGDIVAGWPTLISILLIGLGITNISLGIIAEYLWRTLDASRKRPVFIIDEMVNLNQNE